MKPSMHTAPRFIPSGYGELSSARRNQDVAPAPAPAPPPSSYDYSEYESYIPLVKKFLGMDDPRLALADYQARLDMLNKGSLPQRLQIVATTCGLCTAETARKEIQTKIAALQVQAAEAAKRDALFTGLLIGGVTFLGLSSALIVAKIYSQIQVGRAQAESARLLQTSST